MSGLELRLLLLVVLAAVAVGIALLARRRRPDPPSAPMGRAPSQLDRDDFDGADEKVLIVVFASRTCDACAQAWEVVRRVSLDGVVTQRVLVEENPELHRRYRIDGVPTTLVAGDDGVVSATFFGPINPDDVAGLG